MAIYPPILKSTQVPFIGNNLTVSFDISELTTVSEIKHIQIKINEQSSNKAIRINYGSYSTQADDILYIPYSQNTFEYSINGDFVPGKLYKVQMRFGENSLWNAPTDFARWKQEQIDTLAFSEWSGVMIVKNIKSNYNHKILNKISEDSINTEHTHYPILKGSSEEPVGNNELVEKYKFVISADDNIIEDSGWLSHNYTEDIDIYQVKEYLDSGIEYKAEYYIQTKNGYIPDDPAEYRFSTSDEVGAALTDFTSLKAIANSEDGVIEIRLSAEKPVTGAYMLSRASAASNYKKWEEIERIVLFNQELNDTLVAIDAMAESGVSYAYAIQQEIETDKGFQKTYYYPSEATDDSIATVYLEYSYLYADGRLLTLMFDYKLSSFKHTVLASKQDTLGSKYPTIRRNGYAYYAEFPMSGIISMHMDKNKYFFDDSIELDANYHSNENILLERRFREEVEAFLNNGKPKLFRSGTEGNIVVALMNVTLTPKQELNRMIYSFSATAYEIAENNYQTLVDLGIQVIDDFLDPINMGQILITGPYQVYAATSSDGNVIDIIRNMISEKLSFEEYQGQMTYTKYVKISSTDNANAIVKINNAAENKVIAEEYYIVDNINSLQVVEGKVNIDVVAYYELKPKEIDWSDYTQMYPIFGQIVVEEDLTDILNLIKEESLKQCIEQITNEGWIKQNNIYVKDSKRLIIDGLNNNISLTIIPRGESGDNALITLNDNNIIVTPASYSFEGVVTSLEGNYVIVDYKAKCICSIKGNGVE